VAGNSSFRIFSAALICLVGSGLAHAEEMYGPSEGVVPFGMGRAYSAVADDWLALHYNPAGLALAKGIDLQVVDLKVESNKDVLDSYNTIKTMNDDSTSTASKINKLMGKHLEAKINNVSQLTIPSFAIALIYDMQLDADLKNIAYPQTKIRYIKDQGVKAGFGFGFGKDKQVRFGIAGKMINRTGGIQTIGIDEIGTISNSSLLDRFQYSGVGYGADVGIQYRIPMKGRTEWTLAWAWHDVGYTSYGKYSQGNRPTRTEDNMVAGMALRIPIGGRVNRRYARRYGQPRSTNHLSFAMDYSHIRQSTDEEQFAKHLHFGMNIDLPVVSIQMGLNQGGVTFGTAVNLLGLRVTAATYSEEIGSYAGQQRDRRYLLSIGAGLGIGSF
jgi:hypothetical protein